MAIEIERKFLPSVRPSWLDDLPASEIEQGYLTLGSGSETRIRRIDAAYMLTVKRGGGLAREEYEIELSDAQFRVLWPATAGRRLEKTRHQVGLDHGLVVEVDVYAGHLEGLIVAEVEFLSVAAAAAFESPDWFGPEVTGDERYANHSLATTPIHGDESGRGRRATPSGHPGR